MTENSLEQATAIESLRSGVDTDRSFEILFRAWYRAVQGYFERQGVDAHGASDLAQEVFLAMLTGIGGLRDPAHFRSWLFGIARNKMLQHLEGKSRAPQATADQMAYDPADPAPTGLEQSLDLEKRVKLREALEELPQQMRACVKLSVVEDLQYSEIATRLGLSVNSVKVQVHRARKVLAERLGPMFQVCLWMI